MSKHSDIIKEMKVFKHKLLELGGDESQPYVYNLVWRSVEALSEQVKEISQLKETIHLLKSPVNAERLNKSLKAIEAGETFEKELLE